MAARARKHLIAGNGTVVDATFYQKSMVNIFSSLSKEMSVPIHYIYIDADEHLIRMRLTTPRKDSEADLDVYKKIKNQFQPLSVPHITITSREDNVEEMISIAIDYISNPR
jgi:predicted kinase